jgi:hypothetical protein
MRKQDLHFREGNNRRNMALLAYLLIANILKGEKRWIPNGDNASVQIKLSAS